MSAGKYGCTESRQDQDGKPVRDGGTPRADRLPALAHHPEDRLRRTFTHGGGRSGRLPPSSVASAAYQRRARVTLIGRLRRIAGVAVRLVACAGSCCSVRHDRRWPVLSASGGNHAALWGHGCDGPFGASCIFRGRDLCQPLVRSQPGHRPVAMIRGSSRREFWAVYLKTAAPSSVAPDHLMV